MEKRNGGGAGDSQRSVAVEICEVSAESHPIIVMGILHAPLADKRYASTGFSDSIKQFL